MTPLVSVTPPAALAPADPQGRAVGVGLQSTQATPTALGLSAVTAVAAPKSISPRDALRGDQGGSQSEITPIEPPADPPPVKGLGIPALHTARVGDLDILEDLPSVAPDAPARSGFSDALDATEPPNERSVDLRR